MNTKEPFLKVRLDGDAVGPGRIPANILVKLLGNMDKAFQRTGHILKGGAGSIKQGRFPQQIKEEIALDLVVLCPGSPAAVLGFERRPCQESLPSFDFGLDVFKKSINGLEQVQTQDEHEPLPLGYDAGVLMAWRDMGNLFSDGISKISFSLHHDSTSIATTFTSDGHKRIQSRITGHQTNIRTVEGRLLMADFKEHGTRCRIHPSAGEPILCLFNDVLKEEVLQNMLQYVRVVGEAKVDQFNDRIISIMLHDIVRLEGHEDKGIDLLPQGTPLFHGFWESPSLEELALSQKVQPISDVRALFGTWPGDDDDRFEDVIASLRHHEVSGGCE